MTTHNEQTALLRSIDTHLEHLWHLASYVVNRYISPDAAQHVLEQKQGKLALLELDRDLSRLAAEAEAPARFNWTCSKCGASGVGYDEGWGDEYICGCGHDVREPLDADAGPSDSSSEN